MSERLYLVELLFQLIIVFCDQNESLKSEDRLISLVQINEINHRILNRIRDFEVGEKWTTRESTGKKILRHLERSPGLSSMFKWASDTAYKKVST